MVLTDQLQTDIYPAATLEGLYDGGVNIGSNQHNSMINYEKLFYNIDYSKIVAETDIPSWPTESVANTKLYYNQNENPLANLSYPQGCTPTQTDGSTQLYKLNATTNKTGLEFVIKVMAGDKIDIHGKSYYLNTVNITNTNSTLLGVGTLLTNLLTSPSNAIGSKGIAASQLNTLNSNIIPSSFFRGSNNEATTTIPKAYINYILLDDQFKYVSGSFNRVGTSGSIKDQAILNGFYFSINYAMTQSENGRKIIDHIPIDRILLETDGPFVKVNQQPSTPLVTNLILSEVANFKQQTKLHIQIGENFRKILS